MIQIIFAIFALVFVQLVNGQLDACQTAQANLGLNSACVTALSELNTDMICMGECRALFDAIIDACDNSVGQHYKITCKIFAIFLLM